MIGIIGNNTTRRFGILNIETRQKLENAPTEQLEQ
jgi:hypothetical protein